MAAARALARAVLVASVGSTAAVALPARPRTPTAAARAAAPAWVRVRVVGGEAVVETATRTYAALERRVDLVGLVHAAAGVRVGRSRDATGSARAGRLRGACLRWRGQELVPCRQRTVR